jgi:hypothetical protein
MADGRRVCPDFGRPRGARLVYYLVFHLTEST